MLLARSKMHYVYVLRSQVNGRFYLGITSDPAKRLQQHNSGQTKSTKAYIPWELVCTVPYPTRHEAAAAERKLKTAKSRKTIGKFIAQWQSPNKSG